MSQVKMNPSWTLFPDLVALVPLKAIAGPDPTITHFGEIDKTNSFVLNDESADTDLLLSEGGVAINYTKTGDNVQGFDEGGLGDVDDVTVERGLTIDIGVNGFSHDILAILCGLDPIADVEDEFKFLKNDITGVYASGVRMKGNIKKEKYLFYARVPLETAEEGHAYFVAPKTVVRDQEISHMMVNQKITYTIPLKGLKLLNSDQLATLQDLSEAITNGFEMLFMWNAANEEYIGGS